MALFMIPFYYASRVHSVPGFLKLRYNEATRGFNAILFAIFPGLIILTILPDLGTTESIENSYNMAVPYAMAYYFPTGMLGVGLTALLAAFMSGMAGNVTAFNTVWTYDIYKA